MSLEKARFSLTPKTQLPAAGKMLLSLASQTSMGQTLSSMMGNSFQVQINPRSYKMRHKKNVEKVFTSVVKDQPTTAVNTVHDDSRWVSFDLIFYLPPSTPSVAIEDVLGLRTESVSKKIDNFIELIKTSQEAKYGGMTFAWGNFRFHGLVTSLDINYTRFDEDGTPIRADVSVEMVETPDDAVNVTLPAIKLPSLQAIMLSVAKSVIKSLLP